MGTDQGSTRASREKAGSIVRIFAHAAAILCIVSYMRVSNEVSWAPVLALTPPFQLTGSHKIVHFADLVLVIGVNLWYWYTFAQHVPGSSLYICGTLLSIIASGPI
jgi:hypothetical protein